MDKSKLPVFFIDKNLGKMQLLDWGGEVWLFIYNNPDWVSYRKATQEDIDKIEKMSEDNGITDIIVIIIQRTKRKFLIGNYCLKK